MGRPHRQAASALDRRRTSCSTARSSADRSVTSSMIGISALHAAVHGRRSGNTAYAQPRARPRRISTARARRAASPASCIRTTIPCRQPSGGAGIAHPGRHRARQRRLLRHRRALSRTSSRRRRCTTASSTAASASRRHRRHRQLLRRLARPAAGSGSHLRRRFAARSSLQIVDRGDQGAAHVRHDGAAAVPRRRRARSRARRSR